MSDVIERRDDRAAAGSAGRQSFSSWVRLLKSELSLIYRRPRNLSLLAVLAAIPITLGIVLRVNTPGPNSDGPPFINQVAGNGVFLTLVTLTVLLTLVLPLAVAVVSGDSVAGEAGLGTLRNLLAVPAGRTRLLAVKFAAIVTFCLSCSVLVAGVSLVMGAVLFPVGPVTLLSGSTISLGAGLVRVLGVALYVAAALAALGAIGLALSTLTEHPIGAIAAILVLTIASEIADAVPQLGVVHPYLPTHWWLAFDGLLRAPVDWSGELRGLISFGAYAAIFTAFAWARQTTADVTG